MLFCSLISPLPRLKTYSFCASMMIKVLSEGDAVDGGAPSISLIDLTCVADAMIDVKG